MSGLFKSTVIRANKPTEFADTTATIGTTMPFGWGRFVVSGNVLWAKLPPTVQRQVKRVGKGGTKQESYTIHSSYAIGLGKFRCYGILWIKRNGKMVYSTDPNAPVEDLAYAAKWSQKVSFYYGTQEQLPDGTIEAAVGLGRVSAMRGVPYFVVENDDLTDTTGAVPSYEACVVASPPEAYLTSEVYPQWVASAAELRPTFHGASTRPLLIEHEQPQEDQFEISPLYLFARTNEAYWQSLQGPSSATIQPLFFGASTKQTYQAHQQPQEDNMAVTAKFYGASTRHALQTHTQPQEDALAVTAKFYGASTRHALQTHTQPQEDALAVTPLFIGASTT